MGNEDTQRKPYVGQVFSDWTYCRIEKKVRAQKDVSDASSREYCLFEIFDLQNIQKSLKLCEIHLYLAHYQYQRFVV